MIASTPTTRTSHSSVANFHPNGMTQRNFKQSAQKAGCYLFDFRQMDSLFLRTRCQLRQSRQQSLRMVISLGASTARRTPPSSLAKMVTLMLSPIQIASPALRRRINIFPLLQRRQTRKANDAYRNRRSPKSPALPGAFHH